MKQAYERRRFVFLGYFWYSKTRLELQRLFRRTLKKEERTTEFSFLGELFFFFWCVSGVLSSFTRLTNNRAEACLSICWSSLVKHWTTLQSRLLITDKLVSQKKGTGNQKMTAVGTFRAGDPLQLFYNGLKLLKKQWCRLSTRCQKLNINRRAECGWWFIKRISEQVRAALDQMETRRAAVHGRMLRGGKTLQQQENDDRNVQ